MTTKQEQPSTYPLRLPSGLRKAVADYAKEDRVSMNQFIAVAVAEKVSALKTVTYFEERAKRANMDAFWRFMNREDSEPPRPDDIIPEGIDFRTSVLSSLERS